MKTLNVDVIIIGGGPFGLMLANELGRRGISATLFDKKPSTAFNPQANATQARTMEHYRRLGFADEIRKLGLPPDYPTDVAYFTRYTKHELARFRLPSSKDARSMVTQNSGSWNAAEPPHRVAQKFVEAVLRRHAERLDGIAINYGWEFSHFEAFDDHVTAYVTNLGDDETVQVQGQYLVGGDGPQSTVRKQLGFGYVGETGVARDFLGGRMYAIYLRCPDYYAQIPHPPAWMYWSFNSDRRALMAAVDGRGEFAFHTQLRDGEDEASISEESAKAMFQTAAGAPLDCEILARTSWTAGHTLVAEKFQQGRLLLGGDAVHLFTPTGGLGYNTAIEDAVNLGWKLAETIRGNAGPALLDSYEQERRPIAVRNTNFARVFAESVGLFVPKPVIEEESEAGSAARAEAGTYLEAHGRKEFNIPGITFGYRYDGSPVIVSDGAEPPQDKVNEYTASAVPGGRPPHYWLSPSHSLYDDFGFEWTLLRLGPRAPQADRLVRAAKAAGLDLKVLAVPLREVRNLYEADLALIRPDQIVAWRGASDRTAQEIVATVLGKNNCGFR